MNISWLFCSVYPCVRALLVLAFLFSCLPLLSISPPSMTPSTNPTIQTIHPAPFSSSLTTNPHRHNRHNHHHRAHRFSSSVGQDISAALQRLPAVNEPPASVQVKEYGIRQCKNIERLRLVYYKTKRLLINDRGSRYLVIDDRIKFGIATSEGGWGKK